jgi:hypothetical protein
MQSAKEHAGKQDIMGKQRRAKEEAAWVTHVMGRPG